jgi:hypothetical protein
MAAGARAKGAAVSKAEQEAFEQDGYLVFDPEVPESMLDAIVGDLGGHFGRKEEKAGVGYQGPRIRNAWRVNSNVREVALAPKVLAVLEGLYGRKPLPFQTLNFQYGTQQAAHSDAIHFGSEPAGYMCGVWVALEDMDMDNGPLVYYPGSHKLPLVTFDDLGLRPERDEYAGYELGIAELIERERLQPAHATISKGQAIVWAANLLHGGSKREDVTRTRLSQVTHYYFEGCKYYWPMASTGDHMEWASPDWVV